MSLALYVIFPYLFYNMAKFAEGNYNTDRYIPHEPSPPMATLWLSAPTGMVPTTLLVAGSIRAAGGPGAGHVLVVPQAAWDRWHDADPYPPSSPARPCSTTRHQAPLNYLNVIVETFILVALSMGGGNGPMVAKRHSGTGQARA